VLAAFESSANPERVAELDPATDVDSKPVAKMPEIGEMQVARDGGQYTCFAVVAVLGSQRFDTIEIVPMQVRDQSAVDFRFAGARVRSLCAVHTDGQLVPRSLRYGTSNRRDISRAARLTKRTSRRRAPTGF
jgi:hypothetical protein